MLISQLSFLLNSKSPSYSAPIINSDNSSKSMNEDVPNLQISPVISIGAQSLFNLYKYSMNLERDPIRSMPVLALASEKLGFKSQFSAIRWGDGEGIIFAYLCQRFDKNLFEELFGTELNDSISELLQINASKMWFRWYKRFLAEESDEFLEREWHIVLEILTKSTINLFKQSPMSTILAGSQPLYRGLGFVFMECAGMALSKQYSTNVYFNSPKQLRKDELLKLIAMSKNPFLITSQLKAVDYLNSITKRNLENRIISRDFSDSSITRDDLSFVDQIDSFRSNLRDTTLNVDLVLLGAGFLGKSIPLIVSNPNAVCVDLGSAFDFFGGVNSRKWSREIMQSSDWKDCISL